MRKLPAGEEVDEEGEEVDWVKGRAPGTVFLLGLRGIESPATQPIHSYFGLYFGVSLAVPISKLDLLRFFL
jgi:hypothetical protein